MKAVQVIVTPSDVRYFRVEDGYRYGIYLERDSPAPNNRRVNLCVYRVPEGMRAPLGRIPDDMLAEFADEASKPEADPEVIARYPFFSEWHPLDNVPDDTKVEDVHLLPASLKDAYGNYVQPQDAFKPLTPTQKAAITRAEHQAAADKAPAKE